MHPPAVLITGASTGIGRACTLDLLARNYLVLAGVRREADADALHAAAVGGGAGAGNLRTVQLDVTNPIDLDGLTTLLHEHLPDGCLFALINNAGIGVGGPLEFLRVEDLRRQFEVNVIGAHAVTLAAIPFLRTAAATSPSRGARIVNMSSISGRVAFPFLGPYCASKHALEALSDSLRVELAGSGIHVTLIEPGAIDTPIWNKAQTTADSMRHALPALARERYGPMLDNFDARIAAAAADAIDPSHVARAVTKALESRRPPIRTLVGRDAKIGLLFARFVPARVRDALTARALKAPPNG